MASMCGVDREERGGLNFGASPLSGPLSPRVFATSTRHSEMGVEGRFKPTRSRVTLATTSLM